MPDHRGEFLRGWDNGRGVDDGRALGSHQGDAIRNITGSMGLVGHVASVHYGPAWGNAPSLSGAIDVARGWAQNSTTPVGNADPNAINGFTFDASKVVPTANENRPRNNAVMVIIKAVSGPNLLSQIAVPQRTVINASTGQQNFSHSYEVGRPLWVYMNGVKLIQGDDFTATDGSTISLTRPLVADTDIEIESFGKIVLSDMIGDSTHDGQSYVRKDGAWVTEKIADYALLDFGTVTKNSRYVQDNPFGDASVICYAEVFFNGNWGQAYMIWADGGFGTQGSQWGNQIVVQTGRHEVLNSPRNTGMPHGAVAGLTSGLCRVHVWRVGV